MKNNYIHRAFSFGAGVQSTALLLLIKHNPELLIDAVGHLPDSVYFADTGAEPANVYQHLEQVQHWSPLPITVVSNGSILEPRDGFPPIPFFTTNRDGSVGMLRRQCTREYKIAPIERSIRQAIGLAPGRKGISRSVALWLGISIDEASRMTTNKTKLIDNVYPLIELGWNRTRCYSYCLEHGVRPPKSRCFFCPYIGDWAEIKRNQPQEFAKACAYDEQHRNCTAAGAERPVYLHRSCKPLAEAVVDQGSLFDGFDAECAGLCGL